jgi:hypothetical protein
VALRGEGAADDDLLVLADPAGEDELDRAVVRPYALDQGGAASQADALVDVSELERARRAPAQIVAYGAGGGQAGGARHAEFLSVRPVHRGRVADGVHLRVRHRAQGRIDEHSVALVDREAGLTGEVRDAETCGPYDGAGGHVLASTRPFLRTSMTCASSRISTPRRVKARRRWRRPRSDSVAPSQPAVSVKSGS